MFPRPLLLCCALLWAGSVPAAVYTVGGPSGPLVCPYTSLQAAIDAAAANSGPDEIRVASNQAYSAQALLVSNQELLIRGGYPNCFTAEPTGRTTLSGAGGSATAVLRTAGNVTLTLRGLELRDGDAGNSAYGGGVLHAAAGRLTIVDSVIRHNAAGYGGGIAMHAAGTAGELVIGDGVQIGDSVVAEGNNATQYGGGIYLDSGTLRLAGTATRVQGNVTQGGGGGIAVFDTNPNSVVPVTADIGSGGLDDGGNGILAGNVALGHGGAVLANGDDAVVRLATTEAARPVRVNANRAQYGGAFAAQAGARITMWQGQALNNRATSTGAVAAVYGGSAVELRRDLAIGTPPEGAVGCDYLDDCNRIEGNYAQFGAAVGYLYIGGESNVTRLDIESAMLRGNEGVRLFTDSCALPAGQCKHQVLVYGSEVSANTVESLFTFNRRPLVVVSGCTIAGNGGSGSSALFEGDMNLFLRESIVWQPGRVPLGLVGGGNATPSYLLLHDTAGFPAVNHIRQGDPRFVDALNGDYRLRADSPALDSAPASNAVTDDSLDGGDRVVDLPEVPDIFSGLLDLGAYERAFYCAADAVFCNGFEAARN